jgi:hypothetical protein
MKALILLCTLQPKQILRSLTLAEINKKRTSFIINLEESTFSMESTNQYMKLQIEGMVV